MPKAKLGLEMLLDQRFDLVRGRRVGLVANHSAVTHDYIHAVDALRGAGVKITALFAPEHGIRGDVPAGREVPSGKDQRTGIPVHSLYGHTRKPTPEMLHDVDIVLFDVQDIGCRFYTYIYTMSYTMQACAQSRKKFIVLDRPNPITGLVVQGNIPEKEFTSFIGMHPIPIRHGMTMGELARLFNEQYHFIADLEVVTCVGWRRTMWFNKVDFPWVMPSPNVPTLDTALLYPGTCFFEGTNVSEGRGTSKPFELIGAPWIDAYKFTEKLNLLKLPGVRFREAYFVPTASKFAQQQCAGVQVHIMDRSAVDPVRVGLHTVKILLDMYPDLFQFLPAGSTGKQFFDLLAGTDKIRRGLQAGTPVDELIHLWYHELADFMRIRSRYFMYV